MQCVFLMGLMTLIWALYGYSLSFGGEGKDHPVVGNAEFVLMNDVQLQWTGGAVDVPMEGSIPRLTHMLFQGMFFITPARMIC